MRTWQLCRPHLATLDSLTMGRGKWGAAGATSAAAVLCLHPIPVADETDRRNPGTVASPASAAAESSTQARAIWNVKMQRVIRVNFRSPLPHVSHAMGPLVHFTRHEKQRSGTMGNKSCNQNVQVKGMGKRGLLGAETAVSGLSSGLAAACSWGASRKGRGARGKVA